MNGLAAFVRGFDGVDRGLDLGRAAVFHLADLSAARDQEGLLVLQDLAPAGRAMPGTDQGGTQLFGRLITPT